MADGVSFLDVAIDPTGNEATSADADISTAGSRARTVVVTAREDLGIARQVRDRLAPA